MMEYYIPVKINNLTLDLSTLINLKASTECKEQILR